MIYRKWPMCRYSFTAPQRGHRPFLGKCAPHRPHTNSLLLLR